MLATNDESSRNSKPVTWGNVGRERRARHGGNKPPRTATAQRPDRGGHTARAPARPAHGPGRGRARGGHRKRGGRGAGRGGAFWGCIPTGDDCVMGDGPPLRPGVRIPRGATLVIPAGAVRVSIGEDGVPAMEVTDVQAAVQTWPDWISIALARLRDVNAARQRLKGAAAPGDDAAESEALTEEFRPHCKLSPPPCSALMRSTASSAKW